MKSLIAITSQNKKTITKHAGECKNYLIYTIDDKVITNKSVLELSEKETLHNAFHHGSNENSKSILFEVDILLAGSIGKGAINLLANKNVTAFIVNEKDPDLAVEKLLNGTLETIAPACNESNGCGHHHDHLHHH